MVNTESNSLQQSLRLLRDELARAQRLDEKSRQMLRAALADIETRLRERNAVTREAAAPHGLEALAVGFEADHPSLSASLRQFIELLGQAGL